MNNLILCGFMGCGKTSVGRRLARYTDREYIDLDAQIEQEAGLSIPAVFQQFGEAGFRELEHEAICGLAKRINCVVSTGGGALTFPRNIAAIHPLDRVIFLDAPFEICYRRIRDSDRPLVQSSSPAALRALFDTRRAAYLVAANLRADAAPSCEIVTEELLRLLADTAHRP